MPPSEELTAESILYGQLPTAAGSEINLPADHWWWPYSDVAVDKLNLKLSFENLSGWSGAGGWMVRRPELPKNWKSISRQLPLSDQAYLEYLKQTRDEIELLNRHQLVTLASDTASILIETCVFEELFDPDRINIGLPAAIPPLPPHAGPLRRQAETNLLAAVETVIGKSGRWWYLYLDTDEDRILHKLLYYQGDDLGGVVEVNHHPC